MSADQTATVTVTVRPGRCLWCGGMTGGGVLCVRDERTLAHVCYGKERMGAGAARHVARTVTAQDSGNGAEGRAVGPMVDYHCPVCLDHHIGRSNGRGEVTHADAVLIGLTLRRRAPEYLQALAVRWAPPLADRTAWRTRVSPHRTRPTGEVSAALNAAAGRTPAVLGQVGLGQGGPMEGGLVEVPV